jgi:flagellar motility protein MotE (MotC chaperone)
VGEGDTRGEKWARSLVAAAPLLLFAGVGWGYQVERQISQAQSKNATQSERLDRLEGRITRKLNRLEQRSQKTAATVQSIHDRLTGTYMAPKDNDQ